MSRFLQRIINQEPGETIEKPPVTVPDISATRHPDIAMDTAMDRPVDRDTDIVVDTAADRSATTFADTTPHMATDRSADAFKDTVPDRLSGRPANSIAARPEDRPSDRPPIYQTLDSTHTNSEKAVYSILYRETISKKRRTVEMSQTELRRATGIGGVNTIKRAVEGLADKLSIRILKNGGGTVVGTLYEVYSPQEIMAARRSAKMEIHPKTKKIAGLSANIFAGLPTGLSTDRTDGRIGSLTSDRSELDGLDISNLDRHVKYNINPNGPDKPSSVPQQGSDDEKLSQVRKLFEQLSNGGAWKDDRDLKAYGQIAAVNLFHITLGLCYSVSKSPEHKMSSLAYAVPAILQHAEDMDEFSQSTLEEIAYRTKRKTLNCIAEGKWTIPDWETGKE